MFENSREYSQESLKLSSKWLFFFSEFYVNKFKVFFFNIQREDNVFVPRIYDFNHKVRRTNYDHIETFLAHIWSKDGFVDSELSRSIFMFET